MSGQRCPSCGGYQWNGSVCKVCGYMPNPFTPIFDPGKVDIFKMAEGLKNRAEQERRQKIPRLSICPQCKERSLFYNSIDDRFECLNTELPCPRHKNHILFNTEEYNNIIRNIKR